MSKYFKGVKSYDDLKVQFRELLKINHPDNGGNVEIMKEINVEYDALFPIWKNRKEKETGSPVKETADSTRNQFYTQFGWEGTNHSWNRSLKEVAQIVRTYVKEKYPTYKFSVRTSYASMCQELHVNIKESPIDIYKPFDELTDDDFLEIGKRLYPYGYMENEKMDFLNADKEKKKRIIDESTNSYKNILNETTQMVIDDVDNFVKSYNYSDCDGMIDYFDVDFYYFGCCGNNGSDIKIVPKVARIKNESTTPVKRTSTETTNNMQQSIGTTKYTYNITKGEDTRNGSELWLVRIIEKLDKDAYIVENKRIKALNGYYSKFRKAFIFRYDPTEALETR